MTFKRSLALEEPTGKFEELLGMMPGKREGRIDEGIRLNQRAVKVNTERR
jgi:hypothetical protein